MARVKGGPASHARHRKVIKSAKGYGDEERILSELPIKQLKKLVSMHTEIERLEKETLDLYGYKESMQQQD